MKRDLAGKVAKFPESSLWKGDRSYQRPGAADRRRRPRPRRGPRTLIVYAGPRLPALRRGLARDQPASRRGCLPPLPDRSEAPARSGPARRRRGGRPPVRAASSRWSTRSTPTRARQDDPHLWQPRGGPRARARPLRARPALAGSRGGCDGTSRAVSAPASRRHRRLSCGDSPIAAANIAAELSKDRSETRPSGGQHPLAGR